MHDVANNRSVERLFHINSDFFLLFESLDIEDFLLSLTTFFNGTAKTLINIQRSPFAFSFLLIKLENVLEAIGLRKVE